MEIEPRLEGDAVLEREDREQSWRPRGRRENREGTPDAREREAAHIGSPDDVREAVAALQSHRRLPGLARIAAGGPMPSARLLGYPQGDRVNVRGRSPRRVLEEQRARFDAAAQACQQGKANAKRRQEPQLRVALTAVVKPLERAASGGVYAARDRVISPCAERHKRRIADKREFVRPQCADRGFECEPSRGRENDK